MTILDRITQWTAQGTITPEQHTLLASRVREEPFSVFLELNLLLYAGILAFVAGLGWTVATWSQQLGDVVILAVLTALLATCFWFCFSRAPIWSPTETTASSPFLDYVLYLGCLVWGIELAYLEKRFHLLSGQWDLYLLATAILFFFLAYRFDNRFVLSLALSSLAGWFGLSLSHWLSGPDPSYRQYALLYCLLVGGGGALLRHFNFKAHFFKTYLNIVTNLLFWTLLSGVFEHNGYSPWLIVLLIAVIASLSWGLRQRQFAFVAYAAVYGYVGISYLLIRNVNDETAIVAYFVVTAAAMIASLVLIARHFGRAE